MFKKIIITISLFTITLSTCLVEVYKSDIEQGDYIKSHNYTYVGRFVDYNYMFVPSLIELYYKDGEYAEVQIAFLEFNKEYVMPNREEIKMKHKEN